MLKFLDLVTFELKRSRIFYTFLLLFVIVSEFALVVLKVIRFINRSSFESSYLSLGTIFEQDAFYSLIIGITAFALITYSVFMWAKDWYFQGNFLYRLLILPGNRFGIAFSKVTAILLLMSGVLIVQLIIFYLTHWIVGSMFSDYYVNRSVFMQLAQEMSGSQVLYPLVPLNGFITYGAGISFLIALMNNCIIIFSNKGHGFLKTAIVTVVYDLVIIVSLVGVSSVVYSAILTSVEINGLVSVFVAIHLIIHSYIMYYLMNRYISV